MNQNQNSLSKLIAQERNTIVVPSRTMFAGMLRGVTNHSGLRNNNQEGIRSPFGLIISMSKNKLILAGSLALLAIIVIIPTVRHAAQPSIQNPSSYSGTAGSPVIDTQVQEMITASQGTVTQDIVSEILNDISREDALLQQEYSNDSIIDDYTFDDATIIS